MKIENIIDFKKMNSDLRVFNHHIYEYKKGLRLLILTTEKKEYKEKIIHRLNQMNVDYVISDLKNDNNKINVFFGDASCVQIIKNFGNDISNLSNLNPEQDFILGAMLGYCRKQQCERYLKLKNKEENKFVEGGFNGN